MLKINKIYFLILLGVFQCQLAQDSLKISPSEFLNIVKNYHPLAKNYQLQKQIAKANILKAKGEFDPNISAKLGEKSIDENLYYQQKNIELDIPTWYGIDLSASYNRLLGNNLNNSDTKGGLYQFGINIPLAKNLLYDKRRALLEQAKYLEKMTLNEQIILENALLLDAENTFWEWVKNYEIYKLQNQVVKINQERLTFTKNTLKYGERPAIDTVEVRSQLQNFQLQQKQAYLNFVKSTQNLQIFLWKDKNEIFEIKEAIYPNTELILHESYTKHALLIEDISKKLITQNAGVLTYMQKQKILESEKKLKRQALLPKLDFTYNFFKKENYIPDYLPFFNNNFQYGLKLEIPIFLRQARADYQISKLKLEQNNQDMELKSREIEVKIESYKNEIQNYFSQISLAEQNLINYQKLLKAEEIRFSNGESSLFLINSRENKLIDAKEKLLEIKAKFIKAYNQLQWMDKNFIN